MAARPPPEIMTDVVIDILLRLPPDDTACLTRASLVCKAWRRLLSDRAFRRRYREVHGAAPVLGLLYNNNSTSASSPLFIPTTASSPFPPPASSAVSPTSCRTLDCRHGRVLLFQPAYSSTFAFRSRFTVWDPITGKQRCFSSPVHSCDKFMAAVLCASNGCDHISCSGGPFLVVLVVSIHRKGCWPLLERVAMAQARFYSSDTGKWSVSASINFNCSFTGTTPSLLSGDALFFLVRSGRILKYDLTSGFLSTIVVWPWVQIHDMQNMILYTAEDGGLGLGVATVAEGEGCSRLHLISGRTDLNGVMKWKQGRVVELDSMISSSVDDQFTKFDVVGFAEGTSYIFIQANDSIFSVQLKSGRISKIGSGKFGPIFPLVRFYIPDLARSSQVAGASEE